MDFRSKPFHGAGINLREHFGAARHIGGGNEIDSDHGRDPSRGHWLSNLDLSAEGESGGGNYSQCRRTRKDELRAACAGENKTRLQSTSRSRVAPKPRLVVRNFSQQWPGASAC